MSKWTRYFKGFKPLYNPAMVAGTQVQEKLSDTFMGDPSWTISADSGDSPVNPLDTVAVEGGTSISTSENDRVVTITNTAPADPDTVLGPGVPVTDKAVCIFDGTSGKLIAAGTITDDGATITLGTSDVRFIDPYTLPSSDPSVLGQLYTDGATEPGIPKALWVSGGP
jgi:hypothetical protein